LPSPRVEEILATIEKATPGMRSINQFNPEQGKLENRLFNHGKASLHREFDGFEADILQDAKFSLRASRIVNNPKLAENHNIEALVLIDARTPQGQFIFSPDESGGLGTALNNEVFRLVGLTMQNELISHPVLGTAAFLELLEIIEDRAEAGEGWPTQVTAQINAEMMKEFRPRSLTAKQSLSAPPFPEGICIDHRDDANRRWIIETCEGDLVLKPSLNAFGDFVLTKVEP
jgi:hypothetical protein